MRHGGPVPVLGPDLVLGLARGRYLPRLIPPASCRAGRCPGRQHRQQRHRRSPALRRQHHPDPELRRHRSPGTRPHLAHLPQAPAEPPWPSPATALPRSVSPQVQAPCWRTAQFQGHHRWRIEQSYKQVKDQLGWADFQVRSDTAIPATRPWSTARSASAGTPGSRPSRTARDGGSAAGTRPRERGAARRLTAAGTVLAAGATRDRRLAFPWIALQRWWQAWSDRPPPPQLQALMDSVAAGCGLHLYIPN